MTPFKKSIIAVTLLLALVSGVFGGWAQAFAAAEQPTSITQKVVGGKPFDIHLGDGGVSGPASAYNTYVKLGREAPTNRNVSGKHFINRLIEISLPDESNGNTKSVTGLVYVYFNLDRQTRRLWDSDQLKIYTLDKKESKWVECVVNTLLPDKKNPYGRIACVATNFGSYGLATTGTLPQ